MLGNALGGPTNLSVNSTSNASFSGTITEAYPLGSLTKTGSGRLSLTGANSYTGGSTINGGTLAVASAAGLGADGGGLTINNGALEVAGGFTESRQITFNAPNAVLQVDAGQTYTNNTAFAAANGGAVTKTGAGTLVVGAPLPNAPLALNGGTFDLGGLSHTVAAVSLTSGTLSDGTLSGTSYALSGPATVSANLQDGTSPSSLVVNFPAGTATLSGTNSYTGGTTITQGTLAAGVLSLGSSTITLAGGTFHPVGAAPGMAATFYRGDPAQFAGGQATLFSSYSAVNSFVATLPVDGTALTTALGNTALNFNGPNGANGQAFNGANGPGNIGYTNSTGGNDYTAILKGYIYLNANQTYTFATRSDDGSMLFVNGQTVVNNNNYQGMTTRSGTVSETASGYYPIEVGYYQGGGGAGWRSSPTREIR